VYVGGWFENAGGNPAADFVARWDGTQWRALGSNGALNYYVRALAVSGSDVYVGGYFENAASIPEADYVARWDGTQWHALGSNGSGDGALNEEVSALAVSGSDVYAGGWFTDTAGIAEADWVARWDGTQWRALGSNGSGNGALNYAVLALAVSGSDVYVGGRFRDAAGNPAADYVAQWGIALTLTKTASPTAARPGEAITYTITFGNTGAITATNVLITDTLSPNIANPHYTSTVNLVPLAGGTVYAWSAPDLAPDKGGVIIITGVLTKPLAAGVFTNTVTLAVSATVKTAAAPLTVLNAAPQANAGVDQTVGVGRQVTLHGSGTDDNGDALTYGWAQSGGPAVTLSDPTSPSPTFTAPSAATVLTFTLTVTDTGGLSDTDEVMVKVMKGVVLALTKTASPTAARPGEAITYTIAFSNTGDITATNVLITDTLPTPVTNPDWRSSGVTLTPSEGQIYAWSAPELAPDESGVITITGVLTKPLAVGVFTNTVTLAVSGTAKTAAAPLTVLNAAPQANAGVDQTVGVGRQVTLHGSGTDDNGDALTYGWAQSGGPAVTLSDPTSPSPTFTAPSAATVLTFTLTVTDTGGLSDTDEVVVNVRHICYLPIIFRNATHP
jgi:uncharacterized repeat protein (TIGR01451 family)